MDQTPVAESLRMIADRLKSVADDVVGSSHAAIMDEHANLMAVIRGMENPRMPGRPEKETPMKPVSPVLTPEFSASEVVFAKDQPQYLQLPAIRSPEGIVLSRWALSEEDREAILAGADILLMVHTYNLPLQPLSLRVVQCGQDLIEVATRMKLIEDPDEKETNTQA